STSRSPRRPHCHTSSPLQKSDGVGEAWCRRVLRAEALPLPAKERVRGRRAVGCDHDQVLVDLAGDALREATLESPSTGDQSLAEACNVVGVDAAQHLPLEVVDGAVAA